jgi:hypothetical protein
MRTIRAVVCLTGMVALAGLSGEAVAQDKPQPKSGAAGHEAPGGPPTPKPGPHHAHLKRSAGTWDATVEFFGPPGTPPQISKAVEVNTLDSSGLWLISDFKGQMEGQPFQGHGIFGYDPDKGEYNGVWVDSLITTPMISHGTCDGTGRVRKLTSEGLGPDGKPTAFKMTDEEKGPDTRVFTLAASGPEGKDVVMMKITYTRRR